MEHHRLVEDQPQELKVHWPYLLRVVSGSGGEQEESANADDGEEGHLGNEDWEDWSETDGG